jgi:hypothetical protein
MKIKTTYSSPTGSDMKGFSQRGKSPRPVRARFPLVITAATPRILTSRNQKLTRKPG